MHGTLEAAGRVEWRRLSELTPLAPQWASLAARALEPNVFYEPAFALAAAPVLGHDAAAGLVWSRGEPSRLLGFFPVRIERRRYGIALPVLTGWTHSYAPLGTPLVDREAGATALAAWLDHVAADPQLPKLVLLPYLAGRQGRPAQMARCRALAVRGGAAVSFAEHRRALLAPGTTRDGYLDRALGAKKRKELRRQQHRLAEAGTLSCTVCAASPLAVGGGTGGSDCSRSRRPAGKAAPAPRRPPMPQFAVSWKPP